MGKHSDDEIMSVMQKALQSENNDIVGRTPFHLRNGDLIVWTDISWKPNSNQIEKKKEFEIEQNKKRKKLKKNPNFKGSAKDSVLSKIRREPQSLKIRTYEEYMEDEKRKKEKEKLENEQKEKEKEKEEKSEDDKSAETEQLFNQLTTTEMVNESE